MSITIEMTGRVEVVVPGIIAKNNTKDAVGFIIELLAHGALEDQLFIAEFERRYKEYFDEQ